MDPVKGHFYLLPRGLNGIETFFLSLNDCHKNLTFETFFVLRGREEEERKGEKKRRKKIRI